MEGNRVSGSEGDAGVVMLSVGSRGMVSIPGELEAPLQTLLF